MKLYNNLYISENNQQNVAQFINFNTIIEKLSKDKNIEQKYRKKDGTLIKISSELLRLTLRLEVGASCLLNRKLNTSKNKIKLQNKIINRWNIMPL